MNKGRELLARTLEELSSQDAALRQEFEGLLGAWGPLTIIEEIRNYLVEPTQDEKPIAYWDTQNGTLIPAVPLSSERTCFKVPLVPLYLHPAPRPFIRMTREEIGKLADSVLSSDWTDEFELYHFARDIEDALVEKNNAF